MYQNRVTLIGFLGKDAEVKTTRNNASFTMLSLATKRSWKDRESGDRKLRNHLAPLHRLGQARPIRRHADQGRARSDRRRDPDARVHANRRQSAETKKSITEVRVISITKLDRPKKAEGEEAVA